jgi:hypothetical protein
VGKISAAWIRNGGDPNPPFTVGGGGEPFKPLNAGLAQTFGIGHDVGLRYLDKVLCAKEVADLDLVLQGLLRDIPALAGQNITLFII